MERRRATHGFDSWDRPPRDHARGQDRWLVGSALRPTGVVVFASLDGPDGTDGPCRHFGGSASLASMLYDSSPAPRPRRLGRVWGGIDWLLGR